MYFFLRYLLARYAPKPEKLFVGIQHLQSKLEWRKLLLMQAILRNGDIAIDVGAHIGVYTRLMATWVGKEGRVIAYEPNPYIFKVLSRFTKSWNNIHIKQCGVSQYSNQELFMRLHPYTLHQNSTLERALMGKKQMPGLTKRVRVKTQSLDDLRQKLPSSVKFIKIDVEGHEEKVFHGAQNLLKHDRPAVIFEYSFEQGIFEPNTLTHMEQLNYLCYDLNSMELINKSPSSPYLTDVLAIPKEEPSYYTIVQNMHSLLK